jgi:uncharacterized protein
MADCLRNRRNALVFIVILCLSMSLYALTSEDWFTVTSQGDTAGINRLLGGGADVNEKSTLGMTPLMIASFFGKADAVKVLLAANAKKDLKSGSGLTALMFASQKGYLNVVQLLLIAGADKNLKSASGTTALTYALEKGYEPICTLLNAAEQNKKQWFVDTIKAQTKQINSLKTPAKDAALQSQIDSQFLSAENSVAIVHKKDIVPTSLYSSPVDSQKVMQTGLRQDSVHSLNAAQQVGRHSADNPTAISENILLGIFGLKGVWFDPETRHNTRFTIDIINGVPQVVKVACDNEVFKIEKSSYSNGSLTWQYFVPSTGDHSFYKTIIIDSNGLVCSWSNKQGMAGTVTLKNSADKYVPSTNHQSLSESVALKHPLVMYAPNGRIYVNFFSGGINIANMSAPYTNLLGQYYGDILNDMLSGSYTINPENSFYFTWTFGSEFGYYPVNCFGINIGCFFMGKGDEANLLKEGSESVVAEEHIYSMELPLFVRLRIPKDELSPYIDAGMSFSYVLSAKDMLAYYYTKNASENNDWISTNLFNADNKPYYNRTDWSFVLGTGLHFGGTMHVEYRMYCGLTNFCKTINSKFITHSFTVGFDYYYKKKLSAEMKQKLP